MPLRIVTHLPDAKDYGVNSDGSEDIWFDGDTVGLISIDRRPNNLSTKPLPNGRYVRPTPWYGHYVLVNGRPYDYRQLVTVPYHPYPKHHVKGVGVTGHISYDPYDGCYSFGDNNPAVPGWVISAAESQALQKMRDSALNLAVSVIETVKDAPAMVKTLMKAAKLISLLKHGRYGEYFSSAAGTTSIPKGAASAWLQFKFGIMPLMNDLYAGVEKMKQGLASPTGSVVTTKLDPTYYPGFMSRPPWFQPAQRYEGEASWKRGCKVGLTFGVPNPYIALLDSLGLTNPLGIAWSTMRLSFVIDWLLPIGPFLWSLTVPLAYQFHHGYRTQFVQSEAEFRYSLVPYGPTIGGDDQALIQLNAKAKHMTRTEYVTFPIPWPYPKLYINTSQLATAIAMLISSR